MLPRVFISSTFYDLKYLREEIANFVRGYYFDPVLFEQGDVGYDGVSNLDVSCYKEIRNSDMVILVVGGKYGSPASGQEKNSKEEENAKFDKYLSITRSEFNTAVDKNIPIYAFVDAAVLNEYNVYKANKDLFENENSAYRKELKFVATDNINVFRFIEAIYMLNNVALTSFTYAQNIKDFLAKQWGSMFKEHLQYLQQSKEKEKGLGLINQLQLLYNQMNQLTEKISRIAEGENIDGIAPVMNEQILNHKVEIISNIIAGSLQFLAFPQQLENLKNYFTKLIDKISDSMKEDMFFEILLSEDDQEREQFFNEISREIIVVSINKTVFLSLEPYKADLIGKTINDKIVENLLGKEQLIKMRLFFLD